VEKMTSTAATGTKRFQSFCAGCIFMGVGFGFIFEFWVAVLKELITGRPTAVRRNVFDELPAAQIMARSIANK